MQPKGEKGKEAGVTIDIGDTLISNVNLQEKTAKIVGNAVQVVNKTSEIAPRFVSAAVKKSLEVTLTYASEKENQTARSFMPEFMVDERRVSKTEGKESEDIGGGAGVWGYQIPIDDIDENDMIPQIEMALRKSFERNQQKVKELFHLHHVREGLTFTFEERFDNPNNFKAWRNLLGKHRSYSDNGAYKDWDCFFGIDGPESRKNKTTTVVSTSKRREQELNEDSIFQIEVCDEDKVEKARKFNELAQNGQVAKIMLIKDKQTGRIIKLEMWLPHFTADEEQGWRLLENTMENISDFIDTKPQATVEVLRETKFRRKDGRDKIHKQGVNLQEKGVDWVQYDIKHTFRSLAEEEAIHKLALTAFPRFEGNQPISLSAQTALMWMMHHNELSSYVCVRSEKSAGLQFALVPSVKALKEMIDVYGNQEGEDYSTYRGIVMKATAIIVEEQQNAKEGHGTPAVLFTYVPESAKEIFANLFAQASQVVRNGTFQTSFVSHKESKLKNVSFISANNLTTQNNMSRINSGGDTTYTICSESTFSDYVMAKEFLHEQIDIKKIDENIIMETIIHNKLIDDLQFRISAISNEFALIEIDRAINNEHLEEIEIFKKHRDSAILKLRQEIELLENKFLPKLMQYM